MSRATNITTIKNIIGITHNDDNTVIGMMMDACLADLKKNGIKRPDEEDPLIFQCMVNYVKAQKLESVEEAEVARKRYEAQLGGLMMATGYGIDNE